jgi:hypothetical protein
MNLELFDRLDTASGQYEKNKLIVDTEEIIFENYFSIREILKTNELDLTVIAHCKHQAFPHRDVKKIIKQIAQDLNDYKNFRFVLITNTPYDRSIILPQHNRFLWIHYPEYNAIYWPLYSDEKPLTPRSVKKHFLSLNKRNELFRQILYYKFHYNNWLEKSYFSFLGENNFYGSYQCQATFDKHHAVIASSNEFSYLTNNYPSKFIKIEHDNFVDDYDQKINYNGFDPTWKVNNQQLYENSFCSVILETDPASEFINVSEKTFRAISIKHPLLLFSSAGTQKFLCELGLDNDLYNLFKPADLGENFSRFQSFLLILEKIANLSTTELDVLTVMLDKKLDHMRDNYCQLYFNMISRQEKILSQIKTFVPFFPKSNLYS